MYRKIFNELADSVPPSDNEYIGEDGILRCSLCHAALQTRVSIPELDIDRVVRCACGCMVKKKEEELKRALIEEKRRDYFADDTMLSWTFANDDRKNPSLSDSMQNFVERFPEFFELGKGLLLHGPVGTGKTYYAACIANALIDRGYTVHMTSFSRLVNQIQGTFDKKQEIIDGINQNHLLIIDDLGVERRTDYMNEIIFSIIDGRARSGKPCIVTTNLDMEEIKNPVDVSQKRIFDRILKMCFPVEVAGESRRRREVIDTFADIKTMLGL